MMHLQFSGHFLGELRNAQNQPIDIDHLWA